MLDVLLEAFIDSIKLLPFLFITYLIMEFIEHKTSNKAKNIIKKSGNFGPLLGGILGIFPQCGFSAAAANLYSARIITMGTVIAIFLSTSDEMIPVLISENAPISLILQILGIKLAIGVIAGFGVDLVSRIKAKISQKQHKQEETEKMLEPQIESICEHEHCNCEEGIIKSSIKHTLSIFIFILIISIIINLIIFFIGEENLAILVLNVPVVGQMIAGIIGLIPNCAGSVILTQLYLEQVISIGSMIAGLLVGSGIGILILFRLNKNVKENIKILSILYIVGIVSGIIIDLIM